MTIKIIKEKTTQQVLEGLAEETFKEMVKGVVDVKREILALGGELHADAEAVLLKDGSRQEDLWGFNIYLNKPRQDRIECSSLINIRPSSGNRSMIVKDENLKQKIEAVINSFV